jgi:hypothetical protein
MKWLLLFVLIFLLTKSPLVVLVAIAYFIYYQFFQKTPNPFQEEQIHSAPWLSHAQHGPLNSNNLVDLVLLRRELERLFETGTIDEKQRDDLICRIDSLSDYYFTDQGLAPDNHHWRERSDAAWDILNAYAENPLGDPPWREPIQQQFDLFTDPDLVQSGLLETKPEIGEPFNEETTPELDNSYKTADDLIESDEVFNKEESPAPPVVTVPFNRTDEAAPLKAANEQTLEYAEPIEALEPSTPVKPVERPDIENYAWQRHEPGRLEKALAILSGWHAMAVPFLLQNIGWFIGVFCFIAGSIFLVSYSAGYVKNLIVFFTLFIFTLFLLWGGYQIRKKRPELSTSSDVILILSILLIPLTTATATRLFISSESNLLSLLSGFFVFAELGAFYFAVTVVSALMDRSLQYRLPKVFLSLTFAQLLLVLLAWLPYWQVMALVHLILFAILSYGIFLFVHDWLHSIFVEQRKVAYFSAGMLVYATVVSFVHLTWGTQKTIHLPAGYHGPFLMILCGLLFFVDSHFKQWVHRYASLSRFSFFIYGLSILTLFLVARQQTANIITLILATVLYAYVIWNYLTLTPLYIFLACCSWLYYLLFLQYIPEAVYFMGSLPGLASLYALAKWAISKRKSAYLAIIVFRVLYALLALFTLWSLGHSEPGLVAMMTAISSCVLFYYALGSAPAQLFTPQAGIPETVDIDSYKNLLNGRWFYTIPLLTAAAVFYSPLIPGLTRTPQFAFGLVSIAGFFAFRGLALFVKSFTTDPVEKLQILFNTALLALLFAVVLVFFMAGGTRAILLAMSGTIVLWLSLKLQVRWLFYFMLVLWGASGAIIKLTYFPAPSNGFVELIVAIAIWFLLSHLQRLEKSDFSGLMWEQAEMKARLLPSFQLLWLCRVNARQETGNDA